MRRRDPQGWPIMINSLKEMGLSSWENREVMASGVWGIMEPKLNMEVLSG